MTSSRRAFLGFLGAALVAPAVVRANSLMRVRGVIMPTVYRWSMAATEELVCRDCEGDLIRHWVNTEMLRGFRDHFVVDPVEGTIDVVRVAWDRATNYATREFMEGAGGSIPEATVFDSALTSFHDALKLYKPVYPPELLSMKVLT